MRSYEHHEFKVGARVRATHDVVESGVVVIRQGEEGNITAISNPRWQLPYAVAFDRRVELGVRDFLCNARSIEPASALDRFTAEVFKTE
jgi:hypothetical protein